MITQTQTLTQTHIYTYKTQTLKKHKHIDTLTKHKHIDTLTKHNTHRYSYKSQIQKIHLKNLNTNTVKMYKGDHCDYKSTRMWCINRHSLNRHGTNQSTQHGVAVEGTSSTIPNKDFIKAVESAHSWKMQVKIYSKKNVQMKVGLKNKKQKF